MLILGSHRYRFHFVVTNIHEYVPGSVPGTRCILGDERDTVLVLMQLESSGGDAPEK